MTYVTLTPQPQTSFATMIGPAIKDFVRNYATAVADDYEIDGLNLTKFPKTIFQA